MSNEKNILEEALDITSGDRNRYYGHPLDNHANTGEFWSGYLFRKHGVRINISPRDVCLMMVLLKVSRDANAPKRDNLVDIVGYTRNIEMIDEEKARRAATLKIRDEVSGHLDALADLAQFKGALYIAGPMRGYPRYNFDMFELVTQKLRFDGMLVVSPHEHDLEMGLDPDKTLTEAEEAEFLKEAFSWDVNAIRLGKGIVLLPGWEKSSGARCEATIALFCGKEIWVWDPIPNGLLDEPQLIRLANPAELEEIRRQPSPDRNPAPMPDPSNYNVPLNRPPLAELREIERK